MYAMEAYTGRVEVQLHSLFTLALDGGQWSASCSDCFNHWERAPGYTTNRMLGEPQGWFGRSGQERSLPPLPHIEPWTTQSNTLVTILIKFPKFSKNLGAKRMT